MGQALSSPAVPTLREDVPLGPLTTLGVGGPARWFIEASSQAEVADALAWARARSLPTLVLGGGSNMLVADRGFDGLALRPRIRGVSAALDRHAVLVDAAAGEPWDGLVERAVASGWAGIECLSGIPGDVGATPVQNVGAYGQEVADTLVDVRAIDRRSGALVTLDRARCGFGYRDSRFKRQDKDRFVIVGVRFALRAGGAPQVKYAELAKALAGAPSPSLATVRRTVLELRRGKSMVLDPDDENGRSAGSFFTNPTVDAALAARVRARAQGMPEHPATDGKTKLSAAWLIEAAGFRRGAHDGAVGLSTRHALALVNRGGATSAEILRFARRVREGVLERFGVALAAEPVMVGFTDDELAGL